MQVPREHQIRRCSGPNADWTWRAEKADKIHRQEWKRKLPVTISWPFLPIVVVGNWCRSIWSVRHGLSSMHHFGPNKYFWSVHFGPKVHTLRPTLVLKFSSWDSLTSLA